MFDQITFVSIVISSGNFSVLDIGFDVYQYQPQKNVLIFTANMVENADLTNGLALATMNNIMQRMNSAKKTDFDKIKLLEFEDVE